MEYEILKKWIFLNQDIKQSIEMFLDNPNKLKNYKFIEDTFYLNDKIIVISKNKLKIEVEGTIVNIAKDNKLCIIKQTSQSSVYIYPSQYYCFVKQTKNKNNDRKFYETLLKII